MFDSLQENIYYFFTLFVNICFLYYDQFLAPEILAMNFLFFFRLTMISIKYGYLAQEDASVLHEAYDANRTRVFHANTTMIGAFRKLSSFFIVRELQFSAERLGDDIQESKLHFHSSQQLIGILKQSDIPPFDLNCPFTKSQGYIDEYESIIRTIEEDCTRSPPPISVGCLATVIIRTVENKTNKMLPLMSKMTALCVIFFTASTLGPRIAYFGNPFLSRSCIHHMRGFLKPSITDVENQCLSLQARVLPGIAFMNMYIYIYE